MFKENIKNNVREFNFSKAKEKIHVQHIGSLEDIYQNLNDFSSERISFPQKAIEIIKVFKNYRKNFQKNAKKIKKAPHILIAGGFVRDIMMNKIPKDIDLATNLESKEVLELLKNNLSDIKKIDTQGETFQVVRVVFTNKEEYEIATFRKDGEYKDGRRPESVEPVLNPGEDAGRRDLTINAMFYNPLSGNIIDYVGGLEDIHNQKLRFVGNPEERIKEDKSRMLRYVRFLLRTNFDFNSDDKKAIQKHSPEIKNVFPELLKKELDKALRITSFDKFLEVLNELSLLKEILPEVKDLENCEQGYPFHQEGNVLKHTILLGKFLGKDVDLELKWAGIFHDIAKPETRKEQDKGVYKKVSFLGHEKLGAEKIKKILKKIKFSNKEIQNISWYIENHLFFLGKIAGSLKDSKDKSKAIAKSKRNIKKMILEKGEKMVDNLLKLSIADSEASIFYPKFEKFDFIELINLLNEAKQDLKRTKEKGIDIQKIINGKLIMSELGIRKGGPWLGKMKNQIIDLAMEEEFVSKEEVLNFAKREIKKYKNQVTKF